MSHGGLVGVTGKVMSHGGLVGLPMSRSSFYICMGVSSGCNYL